MPYLQLFLRGPLSSQSVASHIVLLRYHYCNKQQQNSFENLIRCSVEGIDIRRCQSLASSTQTNTHPLSKNKNVHKSDGFCHLSKQPVRAKFSSASNITIIVIDTNNQNDLGRVLLVKPKLLIPEDSCKEYHITETEIYDTVGWRRTTSKRGGKKNPQRKSPYNLKAGTSSSSSSSSCKLRRSTDKTLICTVSCHKQKLSSR